MAEWVQATTADAVPEGGGVEVAVKGRIVAVFRVGDEFFALDGICPHAGGPLGKGRLDGTVVTCPWHGWQFDVRTGEHCLNPQICQERFPVKVEDGKVFIQI